MKLLCDHIYSQCIGGAQKGEYNSLPNQEEGRGRAFLTIGREKGTLNAKAANGYKILIVNSSQVIHGLDQLIFYYRRHPNTGLQHSLGDFVEGDLCPNGVRLHGSENLLHRATAEGNEIVVSELLQSGYRNLSAKNNDGQTAVHLGQFILQLYICAAIIKCPIPFPASFYGHTEVLRLLISYDASVNATDSSGYTPLHFACQSDKPNIIEMLIAGGANPTARNQITGWVPLHEAAWTGHSDCCKKLLECRGKQQRYILDF
jgi:tyrosine-protein kinase